MSTIGYYPNVYASSISNPWTRPHLNVEAAKCKEECMYYMLYILDTYIYVCKLVKINANNEEGE